jgi:hypothetical protein
MDAANCVALPDIDRIGQDHALNEDGRRQHHQGEPDQGREDPRNAFSVGSGVGRRKPVEQGNRYADQGRADARRAQQGDQPEFVAEGLDFAAGQGFGVRADNAVGRKLVGRQLRVEIAHDPVADAVTERGDDHRKQQNLDQSGRESHFGSPLLPVHRN